MSTEENYSSENREKPQQTFLSAKVADLLCKKGITEETVGEPILDNSLCLISDCLSPIFDDQILFCERESSGYEKAVVALAPVINSVYIKYKGPDLKEKLQFMVSKSTLLNWMTNTTNYVADAFTLLTKNGEKSLVLSVLLLTSSLERSLGNLLLLKTNTVPPLLKLILATEDLKQLIGHRLSHCLQLVVGPPVSLNIRNILWHGFIAPGELCPRYAYFLICLMLSIGKSLQQNIFVDRIPERALITFTEDHLDELDEIFPVIEECHSHDMIEQLRSCVPDHVIPLWQLSFSLNFRGEHGYCAVVLLPLFENALRCIFAHINNCDSRMLTAQSEEYYTTFTDILSPHLNEYEENKFLTYYPKSVIELLMDMLIIPEGLRIRDRLSHGQVDLKEFPRSISNFIICSSFAVTVYGNRKSLTFNSVTERLVNAVNSYKSMFHPISKLKSSIAESFTMLQTLFTKTSDLSTNFKVHFKPETEQRLTNNEFLDLKSSLNSLSVSTLFRSKSEMEIITLLRQISDSMLTTISQINFTFLERKSLLESKDLRSRQRENFHKLSALCGDVVFVLFNAIALMKSFLINLNLIAVSLEKRSIVKLLKLELKIVQNMSSCSHESRNNWQQCHSLTTRLSTAIAKLKEIVDCITANA